MRPDFCKHYAGVWGPGMADVLTCKAGIAYSDFADRGAAGWVKELPCCTRDGKTGRCAGFTLPTKEEIEAHEAEVLDALRRAALAAAAGRHHAKMTGETNGEIECPNCKGRLSYSIARSNGHMHGRCETAGCAAWME